MRTIMLVVLLLTLPRLAWADPPSVAPLTPVPPGEDIIIPITKGEISPIDGQLFSTESAIRWGNYLQQCRVRLTADVQLQANKDQEQINYLNQVVALEQKKYDTVVPDYQKRLQDAETALAAPTPWYKTVTFGVALGVLVAVAVGATTAYLISAVK